MPLIAWAVASYGAGLAAGFVPSIRTSALLIGACAALASIPLVRSGRMVPLACSLLLATGVLVASDVRRADANCIARSASREQLQAARSARPCESPSSTGGNADLLDHWRARTGARIDTIFGADAPLVRALLIADKRTLDPEVRDRFAAAGLMHILSLSGLHVAIIARALMLALQAMRLSRASARWVAFGLTGLYVAAIGAPASALRSGVMLGVGTCSRAFQRPVSPWAALAVGAAIPLVNPRNVLALGWQLSVAGFAALTAAGIWCKRRLPHRVRGWRRSLLRDLVASTFVTLATAPLVAWAFGRVSLVAPLTNVPAAAVIALLQPLLCLAMLLAPLPGAARLLGDAAHPLLLTLGAIATAGSAVPFGAPTVAPSLAAACLTGIGAAALIVAAASRRPARPFATAILSLALCCWWPLADTGSGDAELHVIDVGQGDAIALRTPHGQWILVDAGRTWMGGDAGRTVIVPYLRRYGGDLALFILTHPHADHVGGAATVLRSLKPHGYRDAAFAGGSSSYRKSLEVATELGVPWTRVHPGDALAIDGVSIAFLAPDSAWSAHLTDPNLASTVALIRYGEVRFLLTGDAEAPEEAWLVAHFADSLHADVLKVAHHGSKTSSSAAFLDRVRPRVAVVSVGAGNSYGHPSSEVMHALLDRGAAVLRTDQLGTIVVHTDGRALRVTAGGHEWSVASAPK